MPTYQYFIMLVLILFHYKASNGAFVVFCGYISFAIITYIDISATNYSYYYVCTSLSCLIVGYVLQKKNVVAAIFSYSLVFVGIYGFWLWYSYLEPSSYDIICAVILFAQLICVTPRGMTNGIGKRIHRYAHSSDGFDSLQSCDKMYKNNTTKKAIR